MLSPNTCRLSSALWVICAATAAASGGASPAALEICRGARDAHARDALAVCEASARTLQQDGAYDAAFEALMHVAELATQQSRAEQADAALAQAQQWLPRVNDPLAAHRLHRRRGLLAYHLGKPVEALGEFLEALAAATSGEGMQAQAVSHNDLGVVHQKLGDYTTALDHFQRSLALKRDRPEADLAATLANIGSLYRHLGDPTRADQFLRRALAAQEAADQALPAARSREELALLYATQPDPSAAVAHFDAAWEVFAAERLAREQMRVALRRAEFERTHGTPDAARTWLARARGAAQAIGRDPVLQADLLDLALAPDAAAQRAAAETLARNVPRAEADDPALAVDAYADLAAYHERGGDAAAALRALRAYVQRSETLARARHDERLDAMRVRFDLATLEAERDRLALERTRQAGEIARVRAQRLAIAAAAALLLGVIALWFQRRLYRQRLAAVAERQDLERRIAQARAAADALRTDVRSLAWLLDRGQESAIVFDAAGRVRGITPAAAAAARLGIDTVRATGVALQDLVGADMASWAQARIEHASLGADVPDTPAPGSETAWRCERIAREEELGVLTWASAPAASSEAEPDAPPPAPDFRAALVQLMQTSLALWERLTRKTRIDLAERSGVWRVTVDEGRLRVRAMDRYLAADTLPERPRWREVLRTAYFILAELPLDTEQRATLEAHVARVQQAAPRRGAN